MRLCWRRGQMCRRALYRSPILGHDGHGDIDDCNGRCRLMHPIYSKLWSVLLNLTRFVFAVRANLY